jgi:hypothetical protein
LCQDSTLQGNGIGQNAIKRRNPVRGHHEKFVPQIKNLTDFSASQLFDSGQVALQNFHATSLAFPRDEGETDFANRRLFQG